MKFVSAGLAAAFLCAIAGAARAAIKTETVTYKEGQVEAHSVLAYDDSLSGKRPGVLVVPEWWGLNDYPMRRAKMLAQLGYVAMAADIYGAGKTTADPKQAGQWVAALETGDPCGTAQPNRSRARKAQERPARGPGQDRRHRLLLWRHHRAGTRAQRRRG